MIAFLLLKFSEEMFRFGERNGRVVLFSRCQSSATFSVVSGNVELIRANFFYLDVVNLVRAAAVRIVERN